jgi:hypothetical protein
LTEPPVGRTTPAASFNVKADGDVSFWQNGALVGVTGAGFGMVEM